MSVVKKNLVTKGLSGKLGGMLVFRKVGNQTIVSSVPEKSDKQPSTVQLSHQERFQRAVVYARAALADPVSKALYASIAAGREMVSAYNVAVGDYFNAPVVVSVDLTGYTGAIGEFIRTQVTDDVKVASVTVELLDSNANLVERGAAVQQGLGTEWVYTSTQKLNILTGAKLVVKATDLPGNETRDEKML